MFLRWVRESFGKTGAWFKKTGQNIKYWWAGIRPVGKAAVIGLSSIIVIGVTLLAVINFRPKVKSDITIGDITITQADIERHTEALRRHIELNPAIVVDDPEQTALDDLVMNAGLKHYNTTKCRLEVTAADVLTAAAIEFPQGLADEVIDRELGAPGSFMRVRMENVVYQEKMEECMIERREIFFVGSQIYTQYFAKLDEQAAAETYEEIQRRLEDEFMPMFEQRWSTSEIARRADIDFVNTDANNGNAWELLGTTPAIVAGVTPCEEARGGCLAEHGLTSEFTDRKSTRLNSSH